MFRLFRPHTITATEPDDSADDFDGDDTTETVTFPIITDDEENQ